MIDKDKEVLESERLLLLYEARRSSWATSSKESEDFALGAQWTPAQIRELKKRRQSPVVVNVIYPAVEQAVALLTTNKPRFSSTGREDSDTKTGKVFADIFSYIWDNSDGNTNAKRVIYDSYTKGLGYFFAYIDPNADFGKGDIILTALDTYDVYVDPNSKDKFFRDAANIIIATNLTQEEAQRSYPDVDFTNAQFVSLDRKPASSRTSEALLASTVISDDTEHKLGELIDRYKKLKVQFVHVYDPNFGLEKIMSKEEYLDFSQTPAVIERSKGQMPIYYTREEKIEIKLQQYEQTGGVYHYVQDPQSGQTIMQPGEEDANSIPGSTVYMEVVPIQQLVDDGIISVRKTYQDRVYRCLSYGGILIYKGYMGDLREYPITPVNFRHNRTPYPTSDVTMVKGLQELVNKTRSLILSHTANSANIKVILPRGSMDRVEFDKEWAKSGTAVLEADMELGAPVIVTPPPLPNELYKNEAESRKDIQEILGIYALMQGDAGQAPATYKGTIALDEYGQRRIKSKKDDIEASLNQLAKVIIQMIQMVYTEPRVIRLLRPNNIQEDVQLNYPIYDDVTKNIKGKLNDVTTGQYDVIVVSGSMLPSNRWAQSEYYQELYKNGIIDQVEVLKKTEVADTEGVLERFGYIKQLESQLQQAQGQIKQLSGDLQTAQRESVSDRKRLEVVKFASGLKDKSSEIDKAAQLFDARLSDNLKIQKEEAKLEMKKASMQKKGTK